MYPNNGECLVALENYPRLEAVLDVIYNPFRTALLQQAEARGLPAVNGMLMLVAQAKYAAEHFLGRPLPDAEIDRIDRELRGKLSNLVLVGMPGSGKSSLGKACAKLLGKRFVDMDDDLVRTHRRAHQRASFAPGNEDALPQPGKRCGGGAGQGKRPGDRHRRRRGAAGAERARSASRTAWWSTSTGRSGSSRWEGRARFPKVRRRWPPCMRHVRRCTPRRAMRVWKTTAPLKAVAEAIKERFYEILDH